jgi:hypothetical protein
MSRLHTAAALSFVIAGTGHATIAQAASVRAGDAVEIVHDVRGRQAGNQGWDAKSKGDDVYENEAIRSAVESEAKIYLLDRTALSMGPISLIRVDRIVNNPDRSIKCVFVSVGSGTVRWTSGDSHCYLMKTPTATVEPTGTVFDLFVDDQRTFVILRQGRVRVCTKDPQPKCKMLGSPGEMILATAGRLQGPGRGAPAPTDFAERCLSATGRGCVMNLVNNPPAAPRGDDSMRTRRSNLRGGPVERSGPPERRMTFATYHRYYRSPSPSGYATASYPPPQLRQWSSRPIYLPRPMYRPSLYRPGPSYGSPRMHGVGPSYGSLGMHRFGSSYGSPRIQGLGRTFGLRTFGLRTFGPRTFGLQMRGLQIK